MSFVTDLFKYLWKGINWLRLIVVNLMFLLFLGILIATISAIAPEPPPKIPSETALYVRPAGYLVDEKTYQPNALDLLDTYEREEKEILVRDFVEVINDATKDKRVTALILDLDGLQGGGLSKLEEVGQALSNFRASGKEIIAYADSYNQQQYYLASHANTVYINELGSVLLTGYGAYRNYMKDAADSLHIKFHVFKVGNFKDAVEPFVRNDMSDASREHNSQWVNALWNRYTSKIESLRELPADTVKHYIEKMPARISTSGITDAEYAKSSGLVDEVITRVDMRKVLIEKFGEDKKNNSFKATNIKAYMAAKAFKVNNTLNKKNIGLISATGTILDGHQPAGNIGGDSLAKLIRQASNDKSLEALVIRIDSGGGSAFASEIIRQELKSAREKGLPVYISMGSLAASGGYWIATEAEEIWATPATITGSIGVWGLYPKINESFNKLGIYSDGVGTTPLSDIFHPDRPLSEDSRQIFQGSVENIYARFLSLVADARNSTPEDIHEVAQGRVWNGEKALELGLVDNLGYLEDVIKAAADAKGLEDYNVKVIQRELTPKEQFMQALMQEASVAFEQVQDTAFDNSMFSNLKPYIESANRMAERTSPELMEATAKKQNLSVYSHCIECIVP